MLFRKILFLSLFLCFCSAAIAQSAANQNSGIQIITSGVRISEELFIKLVGDPNAKVVFIPTAASLLRSDEHKLIWDPDKEENKIEFREEMLRQFKRNQIILLHTIDRRVADSEEFIKPLREAKAVWISGGNAGRFTSL